MRQQMARGLGTLMIAGGLLGASLTIFPSDSSGTSVQAQETEQATPERSPEHEQMHGMMDMMMGEGFSERMHAEMPGAEEMMESCVTAMGDMGGMMNGMDMEGMDGMMNGSEGMDDMMREGDGTPTPEEGQ